VPCRNLLRPEFSEQERAADIAIGPAPRHHRPAHPVTVAVLVRELVFLLRQLFAGQHAGMNVAPALRESRKDLVNRPPNELCVLGEAVINDESTRRGEEAHLAIEHSDPCRCVLDEHRQLRLLFYEVRFSALAVADINEHVDGTGQLPGCIKKRCRIRDEGHPRAIWAFGYRFHATNRKPLMQGQGHRTLVVRQRRAIRPVEFPRTAELALAEFGPAAPKLGRSLVVEGETPFSVRHVDRCRKGLNSLLRQTVDIALDLDSRGPVWRSPNPAQW
jgi:hypothetical protein